ncbi:sigma-70 family RNA polymerase sigma factor [Massilia endophytica]|uniref:sigma-70 family RNA polymerase sigma factor n=1 Tax=Massilia endophytica TaxID=2899220 RepID=UPI001E5D28F8|nr:sigma-70 family RNA polymerase sigma factor [Massilia endophytica]UGQ47978.1 sigma-70 family RNA polymerase sigma factor [Massilia endophytica]
MQAVGPEQGAPPAVPAPAGRAAGEEDVWWQRWLGGRDPAARERLVSVHLEFARMLAAKAYRGRYGDEIDFADYLQFATVGLLECVDRYDPALGVGFRTYSAKRISGAILDGIGLLSERQQQIGVRQRLLKERTLSLAPAARGRAGPGTFEQLAEVALGMALGYLLDGTGLYLDEAAQFPDGCYTRLELRQLQTQVRALVEGLPQRERLIIKYHYLNCMPFDMIAGMLSLSKGRVSQLHARALRLLREAGAAVRSCDATW